MSVRDLSDQSVTGVEFTESVSSLNASVATLKGTDCDPQDVPTLSSTFSRKQFTDSTLIVTISHGESVDSIFPEWLQSAYPKNRRQPFVIHDLNIPRKMPRRPREHYVTDPPLTEHAKTVAAIIGVELVSVSSQWKQQKPMIVYTAPELRCVETAKEMTRKMGLAVDIRVEPALCDWRMFSEKGAHEHWFNVSQLRLLNYNIDTSYKPILTSQDVPLRETPAEYSNRLLHAYEHIAMTNPGAPVVVIAHPTTVFMAEDGRWSLDKHLVRIDKQIGTCEVSGFEISPEGKVSHPQIVMPFTRNLHDAQELERTR